VHLSGGKSNIEHLFLSSSKVFQSASVQGGTFNEFPAERHALNVMDNVIKNVQKLS
jgi:hypothetical protein